MSVITINESEVSKSFGGIGDLNVVFIPCVDEELASIVTVGKECKMYTFNKPSDIDGYSVQKEIQGGLPETVTFKETPELDMAKRLVTMGYIVLYCIAYDQDTLYDENYGCYSMLRDKLNYDVTYIICKDYPNLALSVAKERGDCFVLIDDMIVKQDKPTKIIGDDGIFFIKDGETEPNTYGFVYNISRDDNKISVTRQDKVEYDIQVVNNNSFINIVTEGKSESVYLFGAGFPRFIINNNLLYIQREVGEDENKTIETDTMHPYYINLNEKGGIKSVYTLHTKTLDVITDTSFTDRFVLTGDDTQTVELTYTIHYSSNSLSSAKNAEEFLRNCKNMVTSDPNNLDWSYGQIVCPCAKDISGSEAYLTARAKKLALNPPYLPVMGVSNGSVGNLTPRFRMSNIDWNKWQNIQGAAGVSDNHGFRINPIVNIPGYGHCIMGNATLLMSPEASREYLSFSNIRMLLININKILYRASLYKLGESNDLIAWNTYKELITPYLDSMTQGRGMESYKFERIYKDINGNTPPKGVIWAKLTIIKPIESIDKFTIWVNVTDGQILSESAA